MVYYNLCGMTLHSTALMLENQNAVKLSNGLPQLIKLA